MPKDFERCVAAGGRVRRVSGPNKAQGLTAGRYVNYCYDKSGGHRGEVQTVKSSASILRKAAQES